MSQLEIKTYPDPCLRIRTSEVSDFNMDIAETVRAMTDMMYVNQGIGLAAPQVGLGLNLLVMDPGDGPLVLVNPVITEKSKKRTRLEEGCLSLPGITVNVDRPEEITVRAQDEKGEFFLKSFSDLAAKVVQHEMDHLEGRMIIDYMNPVRHFFACRKLKKRDAGEQAKKTCEVVCDARK
ncbi:MAG: peptide deformylase [Candidatus Omnitrophica bacterium]|nr:peptide deformylase [Candidatus Omnitrophota bacterium]